MRRYMARRGVQPGDQVLRTTSKAVARGGGVRRVRPRSGLCGGRNLRGLTVTPLQGSADTLQTAAAGLNGTARF